MPHVDGVERAADDADLPCGHGVGFRMTVVGSLPDEMKLGELKWIRNKCFSGLRRFCCPHRL